MKKQYIFILMLVILLYISYLIVEKTYKDYKKDSNIKYITELNNEIKYKIEYANELIEYSSSKAAQNRILKQHSSSKNKWEKVIYLTTEKKYNQFTKIEEKKVENNEISISVEDETIVFPENISIFEKWTHIIFKK